MYFKMPVLVYEDKNCIEKHAEELSKFGTNALIVTGKHSAKANGSLEDVISALSVYNIKYHIFDEIEENPSIETVMKARNKFKSEKIDFVIGIGGGSPLDAAKAIALMLANPDKDEAFFDESVKNVNALPVVAIPTTCGTGSEVTGVAVLTRHSKRTKSSMTHKIFPKLALIDIKYLKAAPDTIIKNTSIDALAHLIESFLNSNATDYSKMFVREGLRTWSLIKDALLTETFENKPSDEIYKNLSTSSTFAGMAIAHTGTSIPHALSYNITYELKIPHGKACAYFLAGFLNEAPAEEKEEILKLTGFENTNDFKTYLTKVCSLSALPEEIVNNTVLQLSNNSAKLKTSSYEITLDTLKNIAAF